MTIKEAKNIAKKFANSDKVKTEEDIFEFTEAMEFLISKEHNPADMMYLGGVYYEMKRFDLALKYYEMAASYDYDEAYECLGYIWYYGRTGKRDYKKAFEYFSKMMDKGNLVATYKVADMYKNGYYVEKDMATYEKIIEELFYKVKDCNNVFDPVPEVFTRLARIRKEQGRVEEAVNLYLYAENYLAQRIRYNAFFGNLNIMKWLIEDLYTLIEFDEECFDFFDLFFLLKTPHKVGFYYDDKAFEVESVVEGDEIVIKFGDKWYRNIDDFFGKADIRNKKLTSIYHDFYGFEVIK